MRRMSTIRRLIEKDYGLEDGELDGSSMKEIYEIVGEEDGALDIYRFVLDDDDDDDKKEDK
jgi:Tfp pilus assembly protein FimV